MCWMLFCALFDVFCVDFAICVYCMNNALIVWFYLSSLFCVHYY